MNDRILTQKELELIKDKVPGGDDDKTPPSDDKGGEQKVDDKAGDAKAPDDKSGDSKADDRKADDVKSDDAKSSKSGNIFDDLDDDDDDQGDDKDKQSADKDKQSDDKSKDSPNADDDKSDKDDRDRDESDWRQNFADRILKGQEDNLTAGQLKKAKSGLLKELTRFKTPEDYMAAGYAARQKIRVGEYKTAYPGDDASDAEKAEWRKSNGIPEKADGYELPEIKGHEWDADAEASFNDFRGLALGQNLNQKQVAALTEWNLKQAKRVEEELEEKMLGQDRSDREATDDDLRVRYGVADFKPRKAIVKRLLEDEEVLPNGAGERLANARFYDSDTGLWRKAINDPDIMRLLIDRAEYEYGDAGFTPHADVVKDKSRITELEELKDKDYDAFMRPGSNGKSPSDELMDLRRKEQARLERRGGRQSAA